MNVRPRHPCHGMTLAQRKAFEAIATGVSDPVKLFEAFGRRRVDRRTLDTLEERGLIERCGSRVLGRDRFGPITVPVYQVPLPHHHAFCEWAAANVKVEETA